jgi:threonine aldolase
MEDYARLCDLFYIGGTKCGMLMGEALVICNPVQQKDFRYILK